MIKLIATDVDGTLVPEGTSNINPKLFEKISELQKKGIAFVAASGRQYPSVMNAFKPVINDIMFIADNGAYVFDKGKPVLCNYIPKKTWVKIIEQWKDDPDVIFLKSCFEGTFSNTKEEFFYKMLSDGYGMELQYMEDLTRDDYHVTKMAVYLKTGNPVAFTEKAKKIFGDEVNIVVSGAHWSDCIAAGVNKAAALRWIQEKLGISPDETMVFGDNYNDIEMMKQGRESYAVSGAKDKVKAEAKYVMSEGAENDGVLHVLESM